MRLNDYGPLLRQKLLPLLAILAFVGIATDLANGNGLKSLYPPPPVPTGLSASQGTSETSIKVIWNNGYNVEVWRSTNSNGPFAPIYTTASNFESEYIDTDVACGSTYYYRIRAFNDSGFSDLTASVAGSTKICTVAVDNCSQVVQFIDDDFTESSTTVGAANDYTTAAFACAQESAGTGTGPDKVYGIQVAEECDISAYVFGQVGYVLEGACDNTGVCLETYSETAVSAQRIRFRAKANVPYYVVVDSANVSGADYTITIRKFACGIAPPTCAGGAMLSQAPAPYGTADSIAIGSGGEAVADVFNVAEPVHRLRWWGAVNESSLDDCGQDITSFDITLYNAGFGAPSNLNTVYGVTVTPVKTGHEVTDFALYQYDVEFDTPWPITIGWVRIKANNVPQGCAWSWACSDQGSRAALTAISPAVFSSRNQAFCLASADNTQTSDQDSNFVISLSELLRVIQFYNAGGLHCANNPGDTEDGYVSGPGANQSCTPYDTDYNPQNWIISLSELLRVIQFYNAGGYNYCPANSTEDGFCPGL